MLPKQLPGVPQEPSQLLEMVPKDLGQSYQGLLLALGCYLNCSWHRQGHWRCHGEVLAAEQSLWGCPRLGWHLPSLLLCQTCQHAGHAARGTGGLLWDVINKFVGLVGKPLLRVYLCGWSVCCIQSEFIMFFFAVPSFLISRRQTWVKHYA